MDYLSVVGTKERLSLRKNRISTLPQIAADPHCPHFKENIRNYNASMSFESMGAKIVQPNGRWPNTVHSDFMVKFITESLICIQMKAKIDNLQNFM